jgi:hypothetical protein
MPVFKPQRHDFPDFLLWIIRLSIPFFCLRTANRQLPTVRRNAFRQVFDHLHRGASSEVHVMLRLARRALDVSWTTLLERVFDGSGCLLPPFALMKPAQSASTGKQ